MIFKQQKLRIKNHKYGKNCCQLLIVDFWLLLVSKQQIANHGFYKKNNLQSTIDAIIQKSKVETQVANHQFFENWLLTINPTIQNGKLDKYKR